MKIVFYPHPRPLVDIVQTRNKVFSRLAHALTKLGHEPMMLFNSGASDQVIRDYFRELSVSCPFHILEPGRSELEWLKSFQPDRIVMWNGYFKGMPSFRQAVQAIGLGSTLRYVEAAWLPQRPHFYIDSRGVGAESSLAHSPVPDHPPDIALDKVPDADRRTALENFKQEYRKGLSLTGAGSGRILVPLQWEGDTSIKLYSPRFKTMQAFLDYLAGWLPQTFRVIVKQHPRYPQEIHMPADNFIPAEEEPSASLFELLASVECVVGLNSTTLIEALAFDLPIIAFGKGIFSGQGVLADYSQSVAQGSPEKFPGMSAVMQAGDPVRRQAYLYELVFRRQMNYENPDDILAKLPHSALLVDNALLADSARLSD